MFIRAAITAMWVIAITSTLVAQDQSARPVPGKADSPTIKVLTGLTVPEFESEMQLFVQALGVNCGYCHTRRNFASDENPKKLIARRMIEMVKGVNTQFFPDHKPGPDQSVLGKVTCFTCHQGSTTPKATIGDFAHR